MSLFSTVFPIQLLWDNSPVNYKEIIFPPSLPPNTNNTWSWDWPGITALDHPIQKRRGVRHTKSFICSKFKNPAKSMLLASWLGLSLMAWEWFCMALGSTFKILYSTIWFLIFFPLEMVSVCSWVVFSVCTLPILVQIDYFVLHLFLLV